MQFRTFTCLLLILLYFNEITTQRISRAGGNILWNLTRTHAYEDNIVTSRLDAITPVIWLYRGIREVYNMILGPTGNRNEGERYQRKLPEQYPFPCNVTNFRSEKIPKSVHQLRPGDIDIIAAMGDSITSATGANSKTILEGLIENRGISWSIGGQGNWRNFLTLPNIMKEFNPKIFGYSLTDSYNVHQSAQFNVAENIATASDMPFNAETLMNRMKKDKRVNMKNHWKLITLMVGGNDFCSDVCYQTNATQWINQDQEYYLIKTLRYLRDNSPRTLVNLVPSPLINLCFSMDNVTVPRSCYLTRPVECSCLYGPVYSKNRELYRKLERRFVEIMERVSHMPEWHTNDFTVVFQPFFKHASVTYSNGVTDIHIISIDCIHFSQKGHATAANGIWNNMLERVGEKAEEMKPLFSEFKCPSERNPYIFTNYNSIE